MAIDEQFIRKETPYEKLKAQYDALKKRNEATKKLLKEVTTGRYLYSMALLKEKKRNDELVEICQLVMESDIDGSYVVATKWWYKMKQALNNNEQALKNNEND